MTVADWIPLPDGASPATELFATVLFAVFFLRLCRWGLRLTGLGS